MIVVTGALQPKGTRLRLSQGQFTVTDGPFIEVKELIGGFAVMELTDMDEAIALNRKYAEILGGTLELDLRIVDQEDESA